MTGRSFRARLDRRLAPVVVLALVMIGCAAGPTSSPSPTPTPSGPPLTPVGLKYVLVAQLGRPWFCDPDEYPVPRGDEQGNALERFPEIRSDRPTFEAIARQVGLDPAAATFTVEQQVAIYRDWKMLNALVLDDIGNGRHRFDFIVAPPAGSEEGRHVAGIVDDRGAVTIEQQAASGPPPCPICLARGTRIATPRGPVAVEDLHPGTIVWTRDREGRRIAVPVIAVGSTTVPPTHRVVRLRLDDGREVEVSPGHPLPDGRRVGDLRPGDRLDGAQVIAADLVGYDAVATFDLLPLGRTGVYWAGGIPLASTLGPATNLGPASTLGR